MRVNAPPRWDRPVDLLVRLIHDLAATVADITNRIKGEQ